MKKAVKKALWVLAFLVTFFLLWLVLRPESRRQPETRAADGEGIDMVFYTSGNTKPIRIRASRQRNVNERDHYLDDFAAEIEPEARVGELIHARADSAFLQNAAQDMDLTGKVLVESASLRLSGPHLHLKNQNYLTTEQTLDFSLKGISGTARKGIIYNMLYDVVILTDVQGVFTKEGLPHAFECREMTVSKKTRLVHMIGTVKLKGGNRTLTTDNLAMTFDAEMKVLQLVVAMGAVRLATDSENAGAEFRAYEFTAEAMSGHYLDGQLERSVLKKNAELTIRTSSGEVKSQSDLIECHHDPVGGTIRSVLMPEAGSWSYQAPDRFFSTTGNQGVFRFDDGGELAQSEANGNVEFKIDAYLGGGDRLIYHPQEGKARVSGLGTWIKKKGRLVHGKGGINVDTKKNELSSDNGVLSSVTMKGRPPFGSEPVMINARSVTLMDRENRIRYSGSVVVSQDKLKLLCGDLLLADEELTAERDVVFSFRGKDGPVTLRGDSLRIQGRTEPVITLRGQAQAFVGDDQIAAKLITLKWDKRGKELQTLLAENGVRFVGGTYQADSDMLNWNLEREMMNFRGRVTIRKEGAFESRGEVVEINVRTQELRILTRASR